MTTQMPIASPRTEFYERAFGGFAGLALAARKLPQPRQIAAFRASRQQDAPARVADDGGDDVDGAGFGSRESGSGKAAVLAVSPPWRFR